MVSYTLSIPNIDFLMRGIGNLDKVWDLAYRGTISRAAFRAYYKTGVL